MRKVILYIAMSLDGFIAKEDDDISFLDIVSIENEDYGYSDFYQSVDTVIIGRKTYDKIISLINEFPHKYKLSYILTRQERESKDNIIYYNGNLAELINNLKMKDGKDIFIDGGAEIVRQLIDLKLIDEMYISIIPILLGNGIRLFDQEKESKLKLIESEHFVSGLVKLHYQILN